MTKAYRMLREMKEAGTTIHDGTKAIVHEVTQAVQPAIEAIQPIIESTKEAERLLEDVSPVLDIPKRGRKRG